MPPGEMLPCGSRRATTFALSPSHTPHAPHARASLLLAAISILGAACAEPDAPDEGATTDDASPAEPNLSSITSQLAGEDGNVTVVGTSTVVNAYSALTANVAAGATVLTVANLTELTTSALGAVARGDLLLVIQMQGASIGTADTAAGYGNVTALNDAGRYELVFVESTSNNDITLAVPLRYSYSATGGAQVVRVPQYRTLNVPLATSLTATDWNGVRGGVVALYVRDSLTINGTIDVTARGFRGGTVDNSTANAITTYRSTAATDGAEKGESIAGSTTTYDALGGRYGRGAPANGGGGGNAHNAGGGGGANGNVGTPWSGQGIMSATSIGAAAWALDPGYIANGNARTNSSGGGRGGYSYSSANADALTVAPGNATWSGDNRRESGGLGGRPLTNDPANGRVFMGGGGGAGDGNNSAPGAGGDGGGIVLIFSDSVGGAGAIIASGEAGKNTVAGGNDGPGGAGGGGAIVIRANSITGAALTANGGVGGSQIISGNEAEGPGGGGGGGYISTSATSVTRSVAGGASGTTSSLSLTEFPVNGATNAAAGQVVTLAGELPFTYDADLTVTVTDGVTTVIPGATVSYTIAVHFAEGAPLTLTGATLVDTFPAALTGVTWTCTATGGSACPAATGVGDLNALLTLARGGTVTFTATGTVAANATGTLTNTATVTPPSAAWDPDLANSSATDTDDLDTIPSAANDTATADEDMPVTVDVLANDTGLGDTPVTVVVGAATRGTVVVNPDNTITYTPTPNTHGPDSFTYTVTDADGQSSTATVAVTVTSVDDVPVAADDAATTAEDSAILIAVLANDTGLGDPVITVSVATPPAHGTLFVHANNTLTYTPAANYHGPDSFTYTVTDGDGHTATATVTLTVESVNDSPDAVDGGATTLEDTPVTVAVLANDTGLGDAPLTVVATRPGRGTVVVNPDNTITYTPNPDANGLDSFTYTVTDADGESASAIVMITITPVEDPPDARDDTHVVNPSTAAVIAVLANDRDVDGDALTVTATSTPLHGTVQINGNGTITYTPATGYTGADSFTYTITDGNGAFDTATVFLTVAIDTDRDQLPDSVEIQIGTNPNDADSDDDGVMDGLEPSPGVDTDGDGRINALDPDSDNDGVRDGTELGITTPSPGTDPSSVHFVPDADAGATTTDPLDPDTDDGGVRDGEEDANANGRVDLGELDPNDPIDDIGTLDSDGDGLLDTVELAIGTDPLDADSDDDGVPDGDEPDFRDDDDGDGLINPLDPDSDNDGLFDATELGYTAPHADTDLAAGRFVPDADAGATKTDPLDPDTDKGGVKDGEEDANHNGVVDPGERDPRNPADDARVDLDTDGSPDADDNCPEIANADQADLDADGLGDVCDVDADGDGIDDDFGVSGGGCSIANGSAGSSAGALLLLAVVGLLVSGRARFRRRAPSTARPTVPRMPASMRRPLLRSPLAFLTLAALAAPAAAQTMEAARFPVERFRLATDRGGLLDVEWAAPPGRLALDLGLWMGYEDDPLVLYNSTDDGRTVVGELVAARFAGDLVASLGLTSFLSVGVDVPLILFQDRPENNPAAPMGLAELSSFGLGDLRVSPKLAVLRQPRHAVSLALLPTFTLPTSSSDDAYFGDSGVTFEPELAISRAFDRVRLAANLGLRFREQQQLANLTVDDEIFARLGIGLRVRRPVELAVTASAAVALKDPLDRFNQDHLEALGGATYTAGPIVVFAAAGLGLRNGFGTPDWRALAGVRLGRGHAAGPEDRDRDGILDDDDRCPDEPEDRDAFRDEDGCPDPDNDSDGVLDAADAAPLEPEDKDGFQDDDGVPDPDNDSDGVADRQDHCPKEAGSSTNRGCPLLDADRDKLPDPLDRCPADPEDLDGFVDDDGCPDLDNDEDGVVDTADKCPREPGPVANNGCPDTDRDGDAIVDRLDNCPDEKGTAANHGCATKQLVQIIEGKLEILEPVFFKTNKDIIQPRSYKLLDNVASVLRAQSTLLILVEGHTDDVGNDAYNKDLSQRRAAAVVSYLTAKGVDASRLKSIGYGEERPLASNKTRTGRATNRRVAFVIVSGAQTEIQLQQTGPGSDTVDK